jgi:predicted RNase H-like nuclease (RuvC/YqgF family)
LTLITQILGCFGGGAILVAVLFRMLRSGQWERIASEWKELATVKEAKISSLEERIRQLEEGLRDMRIENNTLQKLNIGYQTEVSALRQQVSELRSRLALNEAHAAAGSD